MTLGGKWADGSPKLDTLRKINDDAYTASEGKMKRFSFESNPPNHLYDDKTGNWYDPHSPNSFSEIVEIANALDDKNHEMRKVIEDLVEDKPSERRQNKKKAKAILREFV